MSEISASQLALITSFPKLIAMLRDKLDWPISDGHDFEEIVYEYDAGDLGLKPEEIAKVREVHQLRPLVTGQPWGIFFVSFEEKAISVTVLRRLLRGLVVKKRAGDQTPDQQAWHLHDLIFVTNFGPSGEREIAVAHFSDTAGDLPVLNVLGWNAKDTVLHNDYVAQVLSNRLRWPDDSADHQTWRETWSKAFELRIGEVARTSQDLARQLAGLASNIRASANQLLSAETDEGPLRQLLGAFRKGLIHDLDEDGFADMFAQTISYGMLAARISRPMGIVADNLADMVPKTNPFLKELFASFLKIGGRDKRQAMDFDELGVRAVVDMLNAANMEAVLRDFGDRNPKEDPVIHFYELFLREYDPKKRTQRGVFYTPRPVVSFIVRGVDEILREEFGLPLGLADTTTWGELAARNGKVSVPKHIDPAQPFVQILDPATGTGTFLVEVIDLVHKRMEQHWTAQGQSAAEIRASWNAYVPAHLLPRLTAFELMMAPYTIAHMKVGIKLTETGYAFRSEERARIFMANALEPAHDPDAEFSFVSEALAHEALASNKAKAASPFTVLVGNPPYSNYSANLDTTARSLVDRYRNFRGAPIRERNQLQFERNIQDDYVKFISVAQSFIERTSLGIISYITNGVLLSSSSLRGARENLYTNFDPIYELNLHGGANEKSENVLDDENVFDIAQMVAIHFYVRCGTRSLGPIRYLDLLGTREDKYQKLIEASLRRLTWRSIDPEVESLSFTPSDVNAVSFNFRCDDVFLQFGAGIKTNNDAVVIDYDAESVMRNVAGSDSRFVGMILAEAPIYTIQYRPFDYRKIFFHKDAVKSRSFPTMQHFIDHDNIGLIASSTWTTPERFSVSASRYIVEMKTGTHDRGTTFFPLYRYETVLGGEYERKGNLKPEFISRWKAVTGLDFLETGGGDGVNTTGPDDVFSWLFFLLHAPSYRSKFAATLSRGFPVVLLPGAIEIMRAGIFLGRKLVALHTLDSDGAPIINSPEIRLAGTGEARVEKGYPTFRNGQVMINGSRWFEDVPHATWEFHVGGYQVCEKWLKDRAGKGGQNPGPGRVLTDEDILQYRRVVTSLTEIRRLMAEADNVIDEHGGWPVAFDIPPSPPPSIEEIIEADESLELEFKATFQWDVNEGKQNRDLQKSVLKTLAAFINTQGGTLVIGVDDDKEIRGLDDDLALTQNSIDVFEQNLLSAFSNAIGVAYAQHISVRFAEASHGKQVCIIVAAPSPEPVFLEFQGKSEFFVRRGNASISLNPSEQHTYIRQHFKAN